MDNLSYIIGLNNGEGGGASSWSDLDGKPFNTVGTGLTVTAGKTLTTDGTFVTETALTAALTPYVDTTALTTALTPYVDYASMETALTPYAESANLATVATSGDYTDLINTPSIPDAVSVSQTLQSGTAIADITIGDTTTTLYAPSGGGSLPFSSIGNGLTVTAGGALQEVVPLYSEVVSITIPTYGPGLYFDSGFYNSNGNYDDMDVDFDTATSNILDLDISHSGIYRFAMEMTDGTIYDGEWSAYPSSEYTYGGDSWYVPSMDAMEVYISCEAVEDEGTGDTDHYACRLHIYPSGQIELWNQEYDEGLGEDVWTSNVAAICLYADPNGQYYETADSNLHNQCTTNSWDYDSVGGGSEQQTIVHKLPVAYTPVKPEGMLFEDNGIIRCHSLESGNNISIEEGEEGGYYYYQISANIPEMTPQTGGKLSSNNYWFGLDGNIDEGDANYFDCYNFLEDRDNNAWWIKINYNYDNSGDLTIYGKLIETYHSGDSRPTISAEGLESILQSITYDSGKDCYVFQLRQNYHFIINPSLQHNGNEPVTNNGKQNINAFFLPVDNSTIKVSSVGNLYADVSGGSVVGITNTLSSGTAIGDLEIDGITTTLYAPTPTVVGITNTLSSGTAIGDLEIDGVTTTLYAPSGGGTAITPNWNATSGQDGYIDNKPNIKAGTNSNIQGVILGQGTGSNSSTSSGIASIAQGGGNKASGINSVAIGVYTEASAMCSTAEGYYTKAYGENMHTQGKYNVKGPSGMYNFYADVIGNGTADNARSNAEATDWNGNKYLAGDIYVGVTNWADPQNNAIKLANIPNAPTTSAATYTLQATVDGSGNVTYSWVAQV